MPVRRASLLLFVLLFAGCDMFGEYEMRKQQTRQRLASGGGAPPAAAPMPGDPNAAQPMPMPMPMPMPAAPMP